MIGLVSESLKSLLEAEMSPTAKVTLLSPVDTSSQQKRINLFLYRVAPNPHLNNRGFQPKAGAPDRIVAPPLSLNLFYLMTPYAQLDSETGQADAHGLMAEAMRVLHENAVVPQQYLENGLTQGQVRVTLHASDTEELSKLWTALEENIRLSAVYEVAYVDVPSRQEGPVPRQVERTELQLAAHMSGEVAP
jgi:hypothetical protein